jgi:hypothetical protein
LRDKHKQKIGQTHIKKCETARRYGISQKLAPVFITDGAGIKRIISLPSVHKGNKF